MPAFVGGLFVDVPYANGRVGGCGNGGGRVRMQNNRADLLFVALQTGDDLALFLVEQNGFLVVAAGDQQIIVDR